MGRLAAASQNAIDNETSLSRRSYPVPWTLRCDCTHMKTEPVVLLESSASSVVFLDFQSAIYC